MSLKFKNSLYYGKDKIFRASESDVASNDIYPPVTANIENESFDSGIIDTYTTEYLSSGLNSDPKYTLSFDIAGVSSGSGNRCAVGYGIVAIGDPLSDISISDGGVVSLYDARTGEFKVLLSKVGAVNNTQFGEFVKIGSERLVVLDGQGDMYVYTLGGNLIKNVVGATNTETNAEKLSVGSGRIVVGVPATNGNGRVKIYDLDGNLMKTLSTPNPVNNFDKFGSAVSVGNGRIVVGNLVGAYNDNARNEVYLYDLYGNLIKTIVGPDNGDDYGFGWSTAIGSGKIAISAIAYPTKNVNTAPGLVQVFDLNGNHLYNIDPTTELPTRYYPQINSRIRVLGTDILIASGRIWVKFREDQYDRTPFAVFNLDGDFLTFTDYSKTGDPTFDRDSVSIDDYYAVVDNKLFELQTPLRHPLDLLDR